MASAGASDQMLEMIFPFCPCIQTEEFKSKKRRRCMMIKGEIFTRKKHTFGFDLGGSEEFVLSVDFEEESFNLVPTNGKDAGSSKIKISDVAVVGAKSPSSLTLMSMTGDLLLEVEAKDVDIRDEWVQGLNEIIPQESTIRPSTISSRATKQAYFLQKGVELAQKKREADKKKDKYLKEAGGFKFTALAMAQRD